MSTFSALGIQKEYITAIKELGIKKPTEIQEKAIPVLVNSKTDFIGLAQTGTGKTAAFGLPLLQSIDANSNHVQALILAPTRELAQQIKKQFEHYLAPAMVKKLQEDPSLLKLGGDTRELTIMFTDIRGFTPISEQYKTNPQGLTTLINRYMTPMTALVMENEGTVDKYIGDALMAFWNAPLDVPDQRRLATETAIQMLERLDLLNKELEDEGLLPLRIGIGINTGTCKEWFK